jgi:hypothetical protein
MKRALLSGIALIFMFAALGTVASFAADQEDFNYKAGDAVYACTCGEKCPCDTLSRKAGKCTCGKDLAEAKITKVDKGIALVKFADGHEEQFKVAGKFQCACGKDCGCSTISQQDGKCACGKAMKPVTP